MKQLKKLIAVALVFAMVLPGIHIATPQMKEVQAEESANQEDKLFAGYYADDTYEHVANVKGGYKKYVNEGLLNVKLQLKDNGDSYNLRLISSIDSLNYKNVGFRISVDNNTDKTITEDEVVIAWTTQEVVKRIDAKTSASNFVYNYSPKVIDTASEYFVTGIIQNIGKNHTKDFLVEPFWTTMDGTVVYGQNRWFSIDDMVGDEINSRINIPVEMTEEEFLAVNTATINGTEYAIKEHYFDDVYGHFSIEVDKLSLPSASQVTIGGKTVIYRNLYTTGKGNTNTTADKSFYNLYKDTTNEFVIATAADLYGLSWLDGKGADGTPAKFYLVSDIDLNDVSQVNWETGESLSSDYTPIKWRSSYFNGKLDGQMHTIRGLYQTGTEFGDNTVGMFFKIYPTTVLKNFKLVNSYTNYNSAKAAPVGSIAATATGGEIDTVYSSATVVSTQACVGGMIGTASSGTLNINNCQYAGKLYSTLHTGFSNAGGIVGNNEASLEINNSLFNGFMKVDTSNYNVFAGGLLGTVDYNNTGNVSTSILGCLSNGTYTFSNSTHGMASAIGYVKNSATGTKVRNTCYSTAINTLANNPTGIQNINNVSQKDKTLSGAEGWANTLLNNDYFVAVKDAVPELKSFSTRTTDELADVPAVRAADLGWYNTTDTEFILYTEEEFLGFMQKAGAYENSKIINFEDAEIKLGADMVLNEGDSSLWDETPPAHTYTPIIPYTSRAFQGTFNGQGHTISGLYMDSTGSIVALFKYAGPKSVIKDFRLTNSYIKGADIVGSIVGRSHGSTVQDVYSDTTLVATTGGCNGGIVAQGFSSADMPADDNSSINNCWYDGDIILNGTDIECHTGGILGENRAISVTIDNCLYSGWITTYSSNSHLFIGGINGSTGYISSAAGPKTIISNCLSTGDWNLKGESDNNNVATIIGYACSDESTITNCYGRSAAWKYGYAFVPSLTGTENKQAQDDAISTYVLPDDAMINNQLPGFGTAPWIYIQDGTPELRSFIKGTAYVAEDVQITSGTIGTGETVQP